HLLAVAPFLARIAVDEPAAHRLMRILVAQRRRCSFRPRTPPGCNGRGAGCRRDLTVPNFLAPHPGALERTLYGVLGHAELAGQRALCRARVPLLDHRLVAFG